MKPIGASAASIQPPHPEAMSESRAGRSRIARSTTSWCSAITATCATIAST
jgi:hypothetical protein